MLQLTRVGRPDLPLGAEERYCPEGILDAEEQYSRIEEFYKKTIIDAKADMSRSFT